MHTFFLIEILIAVTAVNAGKLSEYRQPKGPFFRDLSPEIISSIQAIENQMPTERAIVGQLLEGDITFYYYTRQNPNPTVIVKGNIHLIDRLKHTKIIIHGWLEDFNTKWCQEMKEEYLKKGDFNVFIVDWRIPARQVYQISAGYTDQTGEMLAGLIVNANLVLNRVHIISHSMGGHVAGFAGKKVQQLLSGQLIYRISALDPSGPAFQEFMYNDSERLHLSDAKMVDVTHSDSGYFGYNNRVGKVEFYPNGGARTQPGCKHSDDINDGVDCSHARSRRFFIESINSPNFTATKCRSWTIYLEEGCVNGETTVYGDNLPLNAPRGLLYFKTSSAPPFLNIRKP